MDFVGRTYPDRVERRGEHVKEVALEIVRYVFGAASATGFCRAFDRSCAQESKKGTRACRNDRGNLACWRERPGIIVLVAHSNFWDEAFEAFGRACLMLKISGRAEANAIEISDQIKEKLDEIEAVRSYLYSRPKDVISPLMPFHNFQKLSENPIARDAQASLSNFAVTMKGYHARLYDPDFRNHRRKYMRGGYRFDDRIGFQPDRLHDFARVGIESRDNLVHLVNAHHTFGAALPIGMHFDVSVRKGGSLNQIFTDIMSGKPSSASSTHENITPCDRVLKAL